MLSLFSIFTANASNSDTCSLINHEMMKAKIEVKNSAEMHEFQQSLADDAAMTALISKALAISSSAIFIAAPFVPEVVLWSGARAASSARTLSGAISNALNAGSADLFASLVSVFAGGAGLIYNSAVLLLEDE